MFGQLTLEKYAWGKKNTAKKVFSEVFQTSFLLKLNSKDMDRCIDWKKKLSTDQESDIRIIKYKTSCQKIDNKGNS